MMTRPRLALFLLAAAAVGCSDQAPEVSGDLSIAFSVVGPAAVSAAENSALAEAFDAVDEYQVEIVDDATEELIASETLPVPTGSSVHALDISVPEDALGRTVRITLVALADGMELYRSVTVTTLSESIGTTEVDLEIRYTGPGIRGEVVNPAGTGVGGVTVSLVVGQAVIDAVQTEEDGTYLFLDVAAGLYSLEPTPPTGSPYLCPPIRDVQIDSSDDALEVDFLASAEFCGRSVLVLSGGDVDDTPAVEAMLAADDGLTLSSFFFVNRLPGLAELNRHDAVLVFMNGLFDESAALGNQLAQYVAGGGNLVLASFYWQGRSDSGLASTGWGALENIDPFTSSGGATYQAGSLLANSIVPHPLTANVTAVTSTGFWGGANARTGTTVVASWSNATPFIGYRVRPAGQRIVGVSLFPGSGTSATGDWQTVFLNAVNWAAAAGGPAPQ